MKRFCRCIFRGQKARDDRLQGQGAWGKVECGELEKDETMAAIAPRFDVSAEDIARVVASFYAMVREHPGLGPVFAVHVTDWPSHEAKIAGFWRNAILFEGSYDGNPVAVHQGAGNVRPGMFEPWLRLFDLALRMELPPEQAAAWSALAHRIGRSLRASVVEKMQGPDGVRMLR